MKDDGNDSNMGKKWTNFMQTNRNEEKKTTDFNNKTFRRLVAFDCHRHELNSPQTNNEKLDSLSFSHHTFKIYCSLLCTSLFLHFVLPQIFKSKSKSKSMPTTMYKLRGKANFSDRIGASFCGRFFPHYSFFVWRAHPLKKILFWLDFLLM